MQSQELLTRVRQMAEEVSAREGCTVYDIELVGGGHGRILRVFIEKAPLNSARETLGEQTPRESAPPAKLESNQDAEEFESFEEPAEADESLDADPEDLSADDMNSDDIESDAHHSDVSANFVSANFSDTTDVSLSASSASTDSAVSIQDCTNVSRGLNLLLDVEDIIPGGRYDLEVSSPGVERILRESWHFERVIGKTVSVKTFAPLVDFNSERPDLARTRQLEARLLGVVDKGIEVLAGEAKAFIPFEAITKAYLVFEFVENAKGGGKTKGQHPKGKGPKKKKH